MSQSLDFQIIQYLLNCKGVRPITIFEKKKEEKENEEEKEVEEEEHADHCHNQTRIFQEMQAMAQTDKNLKNWKI